MNDLPLLVDLETPEARRQYLLDVEKVVRAEVGDAYEETIHDVAYSAMQIALANGLDTISAVVLCAKIGMGLRLLGHVASSLLDYNEAEHLATDRCNTMKFSMPLACIVAENDPADCLDMQRFVMLGHYLARNE